MQLNSLRVIETAKPTVNRAVKFTDYFDEWLETVKKPSVKEPTFDDYKAVYKRYIYPAFAETRLTWVRQMDCQKLINMLTAKNVFRSAQKVYMLLDEVFRYAVGDGLIPFSPMTNVMPVIYDPEEGVPLTRHEEWQLVTAFQAHPTYRMQAFIFMCFTGVRRSELANVVMDGEWIRLECGKQRKGRRVRSRSIPVSPMLERFLPMIDVERIKQLNVNDLTRQFHKLFPNHHLHELRHTFTTRAQECKIMPELVSVWDGHKGKNGNDTVTAKVYTHLWQWEKLQLEEIKKYDYEYEE